MLRFEVILPTKLKRMRIYELIDIIDSIQSFDYDWKSYIMTVTEDLAEYKESEKLTPIPTNVGAIDFTEYVYDEELLLEHLKGHVRGKKFRELKRLVELGYEVSKLVNEDLLEELIYNNKDIITSVYAEAFIVLRGEMSISETKEIVKGSPFDDCELVKASYYYLQPDDVYSALEESYYLIDYLNKLVELNESSSIEGEGMLLVLRGYYSAERTMLDLEEDVGKIVEKLGNVVEYKTLVFNRVL